MTDEEYMTLYSLCMSINNRHTSDNWCTPILFKYDDGWYLCEENYSPNYGERSSRIRRSRSLSSVEAFEVYIRSFGQISDGGWGYMEKVIADNKVFVLSHFTDEELKEFMRERKTQEANEELEKIDKEKLKLQEEIKVLEAKMDGLNARKKMIYDN